MCLVVIYWLLYRSNTGLKLRAVMQNRDMAACMGISARKVDTLTFALGTALAGLAGCALSLIGTVDPEVGKTYIVDSFMVVVLGGVGKLLGTVLASLGVGMSNKILEPAIGGTAAAVYAKVGILVLVILFTTQAHWPLPSERASGGRDSAVIAARITLTMKHSRLGKGAHSGQHFSCLAAHWAAAPQCPRRPLRLLFKSLREISSARHSGAGYGSHLGLCRHLEPGTGHLLRLWGLCHGHVSHAGVQWSGRVW